MRVNLFARKFSKYFTDDIIYKKKDPRNKREKPRIQLTQSQPNQRFTGRWFSLKHVATALPNSADPPGASFLSAWFPDPVSL